MIKSWQHKGLKQFYLTGSKAGIKAHHEKRLKVILQLLNAAEKPADLNIVTMNFHGLTGKLSDFYSVRVDGNWRIIFKFDGKDAILVDYLDYH